MPGRRYFYVLLGEWAERVNHEIEDSGFSGSTITFKVMKLGPDGACIKGAIPIPNYWPAPNIRIVNDEVFALETKYRNAIVAKWVIGLNVPEMAKILNCAYNTAKNRVSKAEDILANNVIRRINKGD